MQHFLAPDTAHELPGQDLDVLAPGFGVPTAYTRSAAVDYTFWGGSSASCAHVAGIAALMLQKNPGLVQSQIEAILESTAMPIAAGCRTFMFPLTGPGNEPTWSDQSNMSFITFTHCFPSRAAGHGLVQANAALAATPLP